MTHTRVSSNERRRWMGILACAPRQALEDAWAAASISVEYNFLRRPETGLVMVRGRACGKGQRFNLGEVTVTRCAVQQGGRVGHAYVAGRDARHAELAALFDALLQDEGLRDRLKREVLAPLVQIRQARNVAERGCAAATRVNFFTIVRGED
ncbi:phosphonate C-P lyase system protein PhnG [Oleidesulfovibrio sp.]|uniref:phosphonate C-P lyase system protein PhnG n=1 Tax=Oleidesulfovibrio sp. TaxID=2909707 RepID=UPI003A837B5C